MAHPPEMEGFQFQPDQKEHHDNAEFGEMHDILPLAADKAQAEWPDDDAANQVPQD